MKPVETVNVEIYLEKCNLPLAAGKIDMKMVFAFVVIEFLATTTYLLANFTNIGVVY